MNAGENEANALILELQNAFRIRNDARMLLFFGGNQDPMKWLEEFNRSTRINQYTDEYKLQNRFCINLKKSKYLKNPKSILGTCIFLTWFTKAEELNLVNEILETKIEVSGQSEVGRLDSNAVVYGLYRIRKPDINRLMPMKDSRQKI
ncbi:hypothetical protein Glove_278g46 [Diversispora epigaea]|uniref:Uncharacterized protein n=1 Tax=Diversispora epigaea TaxID=1348612 RepID=A0A397I2C4_9GLOM|nr:hypothetical protein Glove_278g46 [Diversispora epigaea]